MKYKVKVSYIGIPSRLAYCQDCSWNYEKLNPREGNRLIRAHVAETGHTVNLEKTVSICYEPEEAQL